MICALPATNVASGVDLSEAYSTKVLEFHQRAYHDSTVALLDGLLRGMPEAAQPALVTPEDARALVDVQLRFPLPNQQTESGERSLRGDPTAFYSRVSTKEVFLPVVSLRFMADICTAYVWLTANHYATDTPTIYMKLLKYNVPARFPGGRYPAPLVALHIPWDASAQSRYRGEYLACFNDARTFVLLHELGHIAHHDMTAKTLEESRSHEIHADRFALEALERVGALPTGALYYFNIVAHLQLNRADFPSDKAWQEYVLATATHPAPAERLQEAADYVSENANAFALGVPGSPQDALQAVGSIAASMHSVAHLLSTPGNAMVVAKTPEVDLNPLLPRRLIPNQ